MVIVTTGTNSGLGRYIYESVGGIGITRSTSPQQLERIKSEGADVIIHCAFNGQRQISSDSLYGYVNDNVLLTERLVLIPHKKFIFISTADVYPKKSGSNAEDEIIDVDSVSGIYALTKLMSESMVRNCCENNLILRPTALLGKYSRRNSLIRIIEDQQATLTLSGNSRFNYVLHSDVLDFIKLSIARDLRGTYNLASSENITLQAVADMLGKKVEFGSYFYDVGDIDNSKVSSLFPAFGKTSKEVVAQFIKERKEHKSPETTA